MSKIKPKKRRKFTADELKLSKEIANDKPLGRWTDGECLAWLLARGSITGHRAEHPNRKTTYQFTFGSLTLAPAEAIADKITVALMRLVAKVREANQ